MVVTKTAAAAMRCSNDDIMAKSTCIAARASGNRKQRTGINDTGCGEDATYGNDSGRANVTMRGAQRGQRRPRTKGDNAGATPATTTTA